MPDRLPCGCLPALPAARDTRCAYGWELVLRMRDLGGPNTREGHAVQVEIGYHRSAAGQAECGARRAA